MKKKVLIVVDMQEDFVSGSLGTKEAQAIVPRVAEKAAHFDGTVIFTLDTHGADYLKTQEGRILPVPHCIKGTAGHRLVPELENLAERLGAEKVEKEAFGSLALAGDRLSNLVKKSHLAGKLEKVRDTIESVELVGLCTDICVVSNALIIKAALPEVPVLVDSHCCAGVTPHSHGAALETMRSSQVKIL